MVTIYRLSDRIPVKVGEVTFWVAPLSSDQKGRLLAMSSMISGESREVALDGAKQALKMSLKKLEGVQTASGEAYELEFEPGGELTEECVSEVMALDGCDKLVRICLAWGLTEISDPRDGKEKYDARLMEALKTKAITKAVYDREIKKYPLDGVTVDFSAIENVKKKSSAPLQAQS